MKEGRMLFDVGINTYYWWRSDNIATISSQVYEHSDIFSCIGLWIERCVLRGRTV